jgi:hypothetical protein
MFAFIANVYYWFLWWRGFADTDGNINTHIDREKMTYMYRRMKERSGIWWWVEYLFIKVFGTLAVFILLAVFHRFGWMLIPFALWIFYTWLFIHVIGDYTPPDEKFWEGEQ